MGIVELSLIERITPRSIRTLWMSLIMKCNIFCTLIYLKVILHIEYRLYTIVSRVMMMVLVEWLIITFTWITYVTRFIIISIFIVVIILIVFYVWNKIKFICIQCPMIKIMSKSETYKYFVYSAKSLNSSLLETL